MSTPTFNTMEAVKTIHRGMALLNNTSVPITHKKELSPMIDGVLSFTAYSLRIENPECRPAQLTALQALTQLVNNLERTHGKTTNLAA